MNLKFYAVSFLLSVSGYTFSSPLVRVTSRATVDGKESTILSIYRGLRWVVVDDQFVLSHDSSRDLTVRLDKKKKKWVSLPKLQAVAKLPLQKLNKENTISGKKCSEYLSPSDNSKYCIHFIDSVRDSELRNTMISLLKKFGTVIPDLKDGLIPINLFLKDPNPKNLSYEVTSIEIIPDSMESWKSIQNSAINAQLNPK